MADLGTGLPESSETGLKAVKTSADSPRSQAQHWEITDM